MGGWSIYEERMKTKRDMWVDRTKDNITRRLIASPSFHVVTINGEEQRVSITNRTTHKEKRICSMPGETLKHGGIVEYSNGIWLITDVDYETEVYQRGLMQRCNHVLRWINGEGVLREKWCIVEDGTKYLIGEKSEDIMTIGDSRIAVTVGKDDETIELKRGLRFLIDDVDVEHPTVYQITKGNRFFSTTNNEGVFRFILNEVVLNAGDNEKLRIADFSNWMPSRELDGDHRDSEFTVAEIVEAAKDKTSTPPPDDKEGWL